MYKSLDIVELTRIASELRTGHLKWQTRVVDQGGAPGVGCNGLEKHQIGHQFSKSDLNPAQFSCSVRPGLFGLQPLQHI